nr:Nre family DNA repair protein [Archaeoglobus neptunius]
MRCSLPRCPMLKPMIRAVQVDTELFGSSPPSIFVGRMNYPNVRVCPALPPVVGDTAIYDTPELWVEMPIGRILKLRNSLILSQLNANVHKPYSREVEVVQELSLYNRPVEVEVSLERRPKPRMSFDELFPPMGPSAPAKEIKIASTPKAPSVVEKVYYDTDLKAMSAVKLLYDRGIAVSHIQKLLSAGSLGINRKLVPTRWAITAVDDAISKLLIEEVKGYETIDEYRVFSLKVEKNLFMAVMLPEVWSFEWGEAWYPNTTWNRGGRVVCITDFEGYWGRKTYASLGGCYYSSRLATAEYLSRIKRQAAVVVWREIYPDFRIPLGVWFVREMLRKMYSRGYEEFDTLDDALNYLRNLSDYGVERWVGRSGLLEDKRRQRKLWEFT